MRESRDEPEVVAITGASGGVGRATARAFAEEGAKVALIARGRSGLEAAKKDVDQLGGEGLIIQADVSSPQAVDDAVTRIESKLGPIDTWINCAMVTVVGPVKEVTDEEFKRVTEVNYLGYVYGTKAVLERMMTRDRGTIVQVSSALAFRSIPLQSAYCATKHAIKGFTESLRTELLHDQSNVHVTMVHLPALNTPQFDWSRTKYEKKPSPIGKIYEPEVAADAIVWASHHRRRELTVGFSSLETVFGNSLMPGRLDRILSTKGYTEQFTDESIDGGREDNLWSPVDSDRDFGAHGSFDSKARGRSLQLQLNKHPGLIAAAGALLAGASLAWLRRK